MKNQHITKKIIDKIFIPTLCILALVTTVELTVLWLDIKGKNDLREKMASRHMKQQIGSIKMARVFLNDIIGGYIPTERDTSLLEYGKNILQELEEKIILSPYQVVRDSAKMIQDRYYEVFPMLRGRIKSFDIETGDVIVRHSNNFHSDLIRKMSVGERKYSHVGLVEYISADSIMVYHAQGNDMTGFGGITVEYIFNFIPQGGFDMAIYRLKYPKETREQVIREVKRLRNKKVAFDQFFDISDTTKLYCAELLAYTINAATKDTTITSSGTFSKKPVYTIEDCYRTPQMELVYQKNEENVEND